MNKKRIGILTQITYKSVNYGNYLQSFALNNYINNNYPHVTAETLLLKEETGFKYTTIKSFLRHHYIKIKRGTFRFILGIQRVKSRYTRFVDFAQNNIVLSKNNITISEIERTEYDALIVGSDVVWYQTPGVIDLPKYLPFYNNTKRRFAYAASFGNETIPQENEAIVRDYLNRFDGIGVREKSAISLLSSIGINGAIQNCDPTMLLTPDEWMSVAQKPSIIDNESIKEYVFAYFLGNSEQQISKVSEYFNKDGIRVLYVPYVNGLIGRKDSDTTALIDCSPQEWVWLIENAKYVITDSFHGLVFSILFKKQFVSITRVFNENINSRITDLLKTVSAENKLIDIDDLKKIEDLSWDSQDYIEKISTLVDSSKTYIEGIIEDL